MAAKRKDPCLSPHSNETNTTDLRHILQRFGTIVKLHHAIFPPGWYQKAKTILLTYTEPFSDIFQILPCPHQVFRYVTKFHNKFPAKILLFQ